MVEQIIINRDKYDDADNHQSRFVAKPGINEEIVQLISKTKNEPGWMLQKRLRSLELFQEKPMPTWGPSLKNLDLNNIIYFVDPNAKESTSWDDVPEEIKRTFDKLGIPEAEKKALSGVGAQYDSSVIYHNIEKKLKDKGVIFENMDVAVKKYPEMVKKYFMTSCVPINDHKFVMLHGAVWSGGTFIYVPKGVKVDLPLQAYFRMNTQKGGQFEHTLIIVDEGAELHYIEGCFTKGNKILLNPEYKPIEEVKKGDKVLTHDGTYKKVNEIFRREYSGIIKRIKVYGDTINTIEVTNDHPFLYVDKEKKRDRNKNWKIRWNIPQFFEKGDYLALPINKTLKSVKYHEIKIQKYFGKKQGFKLVKKKIPSTKEFFKLAGYYLAEGSISGGYYLNFSFGTHEKSYITEVKDLLKRVFNVDKTLEFVHKENNGINLVVSSVELCRIFEQFGKKANKKEIPHWMMLEDSKKQEQLIKAYFNGDGNYYNKRSKLTGSLRELFRINTVSEKLAIQCRDILLRLGIPAFLNKRDRSKEKRQTMYTIGISGDHMEKFGKLAGINIKMQLGRNKRGSRLGINNNFAFFPIREIESKKVKNEPIFNFSVEKNETYCVNGIVAHNCSSPIYSESSLHAGCVEVFVMKDAKMTYSSIENWSRNVYNLNTKRAIVQENAKMKWLNGNIGSAVTMLYPSSVLVGERASSDSVGIAFAGKGQNHDTGSKVIHAASNTSSTIDSKSISKDGGIATYRGLIHVAKDAKDCKSYMKCNGLLLDKGLGSRSDAIPVLEIKNSDVEAAHEATVGKIGDEEIFYLMSRGLSEDEAIKIIVAGFIGPLTKALPLEYAVELNKLIELEIEGH